ncbi:hypothetical protein Dsin_003230 [Dipteronia sinensis]|uniref:RING-type E3 ubiquitin transferase n=1 Tax=Dipteronia sinensis TaxID=43782 RepID=A0AAE0B935_9ROSI|nr:hypothetical protein Dsin_003230 [Dipteronia sinensis]
MQGQRGTIGSLPETLSFDHGSTSNSAVDQQICWNNMRNPAENRLPDYMISPPGANMPYMNSMSHERPTLGGGWSLGEPSSSGPQNEVGRDERKTELGWSSLTPCRGAGSRSEEQQCEPTNSLPVDGGNLNPLFVQSSNSNLMSPSINLNAGFVNHDGASCHMGGCPNPYKSGASEHQVIPPASSSESFLLPSGGNGYLVEENESRPGCSYEGRRTSCKRKALAASVEQSPANGSCSYFQRAESSVWPAVSAHYDGGSSLSMSAPSEQANSGLVLGVRGAASDHIPDSYVAGIAESSRRNLRVRINPSNQQESIPPPLLGSVRHSNVSSTHQSSRLLPNDQSLDSRSAPVVDNMNSQSQPVAMHVPTLPRNAQPFRWDRGSSSRTGSSLSSNFSRDRDAFSREETRSRSMGRNILEQPVFMPAPDMRNFVRNPANRSLAGGNMSIPGNVASSSRTGSSSGVPRSSAAPTWAPHPNAPSPHQYPRRFSEFVRRSLISSLGSESGVQGSNQTPLQPPSPEEIALMSGAGNHGHHQSFPRSASLLDRHGDGVLGFPHPLRTLAAASEGGRSRLVVSEQIRNVLDLMRRGENLRFEDVMILDQSVFFGVADIHDRHRDMRLDVDNMSYEELLALEERIGNVNTGLSEETIMNRLKQRKYSIPVGSSQQETEPCCVCQEEYDDGDGLGTLECGHDFHTHCIKQWLLLKNICPICKTTGLSK